MAGPNEQIVVEVKDRIAPTIKVGLEDIARTADRAQGKVDGLNKAMQALGGSARAFSTAWSGGLAKAEAALGRMSSAENKVTRSATQAAIAEQRLAAAVARTTSAQAAAAAATARVAKEESSAAKAATQAETATLRYAAAQKRLEQSSESSSLAIKRQQASMRLASKQGPSGGGGGGLGSQLMGGLQSSGLGGSLMRGGLYGAVALGAIEGAKAVGTYADSFNVLRNRLQNVTGSLETTGPLIDRIRRIANDTAAPINETGEAFVRFDRALKQMGKTQEDSLQFTETLQGMLFRYGKTGSEAASVTLQLSQAMGKGKLDGDEFKSVFENLPELMEQIGKELGASKAELRELAPQGKITGEVIAKAMMNSKAALDALPQPLDTVDASMTRLTNNATQFFGELSAGQAIVGAFTGTLNALAKALEKADRPPKEKAGDPTGEKVSYYGKKQADALAAFEASKKAAKDVATAREGFLNTETALLQRNVELLQMSEDKRFVEAGLDKLKTDALKDGIKLTDDYLGTQKAVLEQTYKLQEAEKKSKGGPKGVDRAAELMKVNLELDNEIGRMGMLSQAREQQQRYDRISESLLSKKIVLDAEEAKSIREKIDAISRMNEVQGKADALYAEATGAQRDYNITIAATNKLLAEGNISQEKHAQNVALATLAYIRSTDSMYDSTNAHHDQLKLLQLNSREREIEAVAIAFERAQIEKGLPVYEFEKQLMRDRAIELRGLTEARSAEDAILAATIDKMRQQKEAIKGLITVRATLADQIEKENPEKSKEWAQTQAKGQIAQQVMAVGGDNMSGTETWYKAVLQSETDYYAQIDQMRQANLISEQEAETAKLRMRLQTNDQMLSMASGFFSNFEGMQRSNVNEMAAIGKAAAIANATIQMYMAANAAYAAMAGIPVIGPGLGAAAAAGALASGMANIAQIAAQPTGFKAGGYTGSGGTNQVAGVVHGQEYVFDAASTQRIGRENLDAMRSGAAMAPGNDNGGGSARALELTVIVVGTKEEAQEVASTVEGDKIVLDGIGRNTRKIKKMLGVG